MRIAICDDEEKHLKHTATVLEQLYKSLDLLIEEFTEGKALLKRCQQCMYDAIILDIEMPESNGIEVARKIRELSEKVEIIFLTSHVEYALEGYEVNALRYLTKPVQEKKIEELLQYLLEKEKRQKKLLLKCKEEVVSVSIADICYIEAQNHDLRVVTLDGEFVVRGKLAAYENDCQGMGFYRVHRGYLVNLAHVVRVKEGQVYLERGEVVPISRGKEKQTKEALHLYVQEVAL